MTELVSITLENEMDLILAYKRSIRMAELLGLSISTQTAFSTAVSEVCREVIDKAIHGVAVLGTTTDTGRYYMVAQISGVVEEDFNRHNEGFEYARKLVPVLNTSISGDRLQVELRLSIPRHTKVDAHKVLLVKEQFKKEGPISAYEEVKLQNVVLHQLNLQHETALTEARYLDSQKNEFLSVVSHEINSPLTILRSFAQLAVRADKGQNETLTKYLKKIDTQTLKLNNLVQQLLDISKIENGEIMYNRKPTDLNEFITELSESLTVLISSHTLEISLDSTCNVFIDKLRFEQVLSNLVGNAAKYSVAGSPVRLYTRKEQGGVTVCVEDKGIGMSDDTIANVFNKFYRSEGVIHKYSGLGMGLYITSRIINDHQGTVNVTSKEGEGSCFSFTLSAHN
ncbi:sensor histidine kinase [Mucilaginibacter terrenus]|uniref:histidine kinase n=1 Tax=Mucilaginibacter terrenus TaxID=2482727 RepID=A0A3E2NP26_9SPHI|nr:HAMP domain-containing sensor histidine kinase [Mucilaginibacter terrenus]RFZ82701.1 sensor histidine kinase [Mucilaginibacter terrenus]